MSSSILGRHFQKLKVSICRVDQVVLFILTCSLLEGTGSCVTHCGCGSGIGFNYFILIDKTFGEIVNRPFCSRVKAPRGTDMSELSGRDDNILFRMYLSCRGAPISRNLFAMFTIPLIWLLMSLSKGVCDIIMILVELLDHICR